MKAALIVKPKGELKETVENAVKILESKGITPLLEKETVERLILNRESCSISDMRSMADAVIVLGGDGTLLYASRMFRFLNVPVIGFNLGRLGFIMEHNIEDFEKVINDFINKKLIIKKRMKVDGIILENGENVFEEEALNEIVINKGAPSRMIELSIFINNSFVTRYRADGAIISTPTGSTGYTISAGGPIVHPDLDSIILSPICPHALNIRPIVLPKTSTIDIRIETSNVECYATYDGQIVRPFNSGSILKVQRSSADLNLAISENRNYYSILRDKLGWGGIPC
ncbi:MAG: NAD(+)/NADH kinase [Mucispirillum sp.]|uniref:NAD kinase n=1 Tax=Candidatus Mucispirillum faecigallinarum TaxID=2838699 RepID=A0A9D2GUQ0_9BACT|nr:NAD(+)/NADH kinase [Mucispirillum sp.]HIZ89370.1 NAD(+)/NADH kinase [Candidatus Mucispirillum faecigallinarum]